MILQLINNPVALIIAVGILLISIAVHEFAHAITADRLGDPTPKAKGRVTLNPIVHIDPVGLLFILFWGFGWGKPVPFDPFNLRNPARDTALIALAGPISSILLAVILAILMFFVPPLLTTVFVFAIHLNVFLAIFNLVPIYPLDGFHVVAGFIPEGQRDDWLRLKRYGLIILLVLLIPIGGTSPLIRLVSPIANFIFALLIPGGNIV